jgi:Predicted nucleotide-binding protein containing TIR-like domain
MDPPKPLPSVNADLVAQYLQSLKTPSQGPAITPAPPKSILDRARDATIALRTPIAEGKLTKPIQVQWAARIRDALKPLYGEKSPLLVTLNQWVKEISKTQLPAEEFCARVAQVEHFLASMSAPGSSGSFVLASRSSLIPATKNVFVIHGHDEPNQLRLRLLLSDEFKLLPIAILNKPGRSATTIDKFEEHAQTCSYAIALFSKDDKITGKGGDDYWQPRPNVIFETGWFVGRLGRERVLILLQEGVKIHSDFDGVNRIQFQSDVEDKFRSIQAELQAARLI